MRHLMFLLGLVFLTHFFTGCSGCHRENSSEVKEESRPDYSRITVNRVLKTELKPGTGKEATPNSTVRVKYQGWIYDPAKLANRGAEFASSQDGSFKFTIGKGEVIKGWEEGIIGMKEHGQRRLVIPIELAYGKAGAQNVPPDSILMIEAELVKVE